jgi:hypothetical protein
MYHEYKKEILPAIEKSNYLAEHNMEWKDSFVRQRPGPENSLGLVFYSQFECHLFA